MRVFPKIKIKTKVKTKATPVRSGVFDRAPWALLAHLGRVEFEAHLAPLTTFGTGGRAAILARPESVSELAEILEISRLHNLPHFLLGGGSNVLFADDNAGFGFGFGFGGVVIKLGSAFGRLEALPLVGKRGLKAGAAALGSRVLAEATKLGLSGLEGLAGIPGTIGGATMMNAGSFGRELGPVVDKIRWWSPSEGLVVSGRNCLEFGYRSLAFLLKEGSRGKEGARPGGVILELELQLTPDNTENIRTRISSNLERRRATQPKGVRCAGSIFKNPPNQAAGRLIEECGFKGMRVGGAMVSEKHANFIVNTGEATSGDILSLIQDIIKVVLERRGVILTPEIKIMAPGGEVINP